MSTRPNPPCCALQAENLNRQGSIRGQDQRKRCWRGESRATEKGLRSWTDRCWRDAAPERRSSALAEPLYPRRSVTGSNPTLSARRPINLNKIKGRWGVTHKLTHNGLRSGGRKAARAGSGGGDRERRVAARARSATQPCISAIANKISATAMSTDRARVCIYLRRSLHPALARRGGFLFLNPISRHVEVIKAPSSK